MPQKVEAVKVVTEYLADDPRVQAGVAQGQVHVRGELVSTVRTRFVAQESGSSRVRWPRTFRVRYTARMEIGDPSTSLIRRVCAREDEAWNRFFNVYRPLVARYIGKISRQWGISWDEQLNEDAVQEVFLRLIRSLRNYQPGRPKVGPDGRPVGGTTRFTTYLYQVVISAVADSAKRLRRAAVKPQPPGPEPPVDWIRDLQQAIYDSVVAEIRPGMLLENPKKWLSYEEQLVKGRSAKEVAEELGISTDSVYQNSSRVLKLLQGRCQEELQAELS
jgi:RNA polymerase sigma factor (sigma-70 family)